jgi:predicted AlkP superfamily phosphohydrolase/phosphomutase
MYEKMDEMVGRTRRALGKDSVLIVMSDHGFKPFRRGVNLNVWLHEQGYLALKGEPDASEWYRNVDWSRTRAYAFGIGGIYLNVAGREAEGIVQPGEEARALKRELIERLRNLKDDAPAGPKTDGRSAVADVYDAVEVYRGPYAADGPDLIVGFSVGYRASWKCATGVIDSEVFEDNERSWSGDHCMNPPDVPGVFFCSRPVEADPVDIMDIGPTLLDLFGVSVPAYCDGKPLLPVQSKH